MNQFYTVGTDFWYLMLAAYLGWFLIVREARLVREGGLRREALVLFCMLAATTAVTCFMGDVVCWVFNT
ncbi:MAG: hypothetical protein HQ488_02185 [Parcubacteria group bacterium]|nr:hypothetical protein [Parcubacteria group bacterium]